MNKPFANEPEPSWLRLAPPHPQPDEYGALDTSAPHPLELPAEELAELMDGPDYSSSQVTSSTSFSFLDPIWWSLGNVAEFIEANTENDDPDSSPIFSGLKRVEQAIRSGELQAYGSIDAAPVRPIPVEVWTEFVMIPSNIAPSSDGSVTYDVSVRSVRSYRAGALHDHSFPAGELVPSASSPEGEPGYHRVISSPFVKENEARKVFVARAAKTRQRRVGDKQRRLAGTLSRLTIKGRKVYPDRGGLSFAEITRSVVKDWRREDERQGREVVEYNLPSEEQAVRRFYNSET